MNNTIDTLKQPESTSVDFSAFTDEQVDAVVIYVAKIARETRTEHGLNTEQKAKRINQAMAIMDSWPRDFYKRVTDRVIHAKDSFWSVPADAMITATKAVEFGL